ncbi:MAG: M1 family metallopeptidase [Nitrospira sp.]
MHRLIRFSLLALLLLPALAVAEPDSRHPTITHHQLALELFPDSHQLVATDQLTIAGGASGQELAFSLAPTLHLERIEDVTLCQNRCDSAASIVFERDGSPGQPEFQRIILRQPSTNSGDGSVQLKFSYRGVIDDPPRDPRHLRFVTPSETSGHIGPEGVYLSSESQWYPDLEESLATYDVTLTVPDGWVAVTQGTRQADPARWVVSSKSEALTVVANRFIVKTRAWESKSGQAIQLATYLFPEEAALAYEYLDASARYLDAYIPLLGPYPFSQFAVVENFFSSGLSMPSFTLLGSGVIKRHYTQPYALGHEIVHSWIGNGVFNRVSQGNWVEGLTTYLSNYYYHELTGDEAQAREQRRLMLLGYSVYVRQGDDYPLGNFAQKRDEKDNAIGYQKSAMVFHLLRQEIGEAAFWRALKQIPERYLGAVADWKDLERIFQEAAGRDLRWFFAQWVERAGAPDLELSGLRVQPVHGMSGQAGTIAAVVQVAQRGVPYRVPLDLEFVLDGGRSQPVRIQMVGAQQDVIVPLTERPLAVRLDPDYHLFRRVARRDMAPMLNLYVTDAKRTVVLPPDAPSDQPGPLGEIVQRIVAQEAAKPGAQRTTVRQPGAEDSQVPDGSLLVLGHPGENPIASQALRYCGDHVRLADNGFSVGRRMFEGPTMALLASCRRDDYPGSVVTFLYGVTPQALSRVARLLFFYGWQSYVVFHDGAVTARGDWEDTMSPEVRFETE